MGSSVRPAAGLAALAALFVGVLVLLAWLLALPGYWAAKLLLAIAAIGLVVRGWRGLGRGHREIARFLAALEHGDLTQGFRSAGHGPGLDELGDALERSLARLRRERREAAEDNRFAAALVDETPTPLLVVADDGIVRLANKAARTLFREADGRATTTFARYGEDFARELATASPGSRKVCRVRWNGLSHRAVLQAVAMERRGGAVRIVSVNLIQTELEAAEIAVQTDLVRVLTHEIMNSLTPVVSLAGSAVQLLAEAEHGDADAIGDARRAIETLERRSAGIAGFVESYREFSQSPSLAVARFAVGPWADEIVASFRSMPVAADVALDIAIDRPEARIDADAELLGQLLLNLLKNAAESAAEGDPRVALRIRPGDAGRTAIEVADNGPGVPDGLEEEIFLPFFTTRRGGTGVGLSFARQVATLHGGSIGVARAEAGGALFTVIL